MKQIQIAYIAGPYGDAGGYLKIEENITKARVAADWLVRNGIGFLAPHMNAAHFECILPNVPVDFWYEMDLKLMLVCDVMIVLDGSEGSKGTQKELAAWKKLGRPWYYAWEGGAILKWKAEVEFDAAG